MKKVVKELLAIEQEQAQAQSTFGGVKSKAQVEWCVQQKEWYMQFDARCNEKNKDKTAPTTSKTGNNNHHAT